MQQRASISPERLRYSLEHRDLAVFLKERETHTHRDRETETDRHRQTDRQTDIVNDSDRNGDRDRESVEQKSKYVLDP